MHNLEIGTKFRDSENAQHNFEIAQIPKLRGTYIRQLLVMFRNRNVDAQPCDGTTWSSRVLVIGIVDVLDKLVEQVRRNQHLELLLLFAGDNA